MTLPDGSKAKLGDIVVLRGGAFPYFDRSKGRYKNVYYPPSLATVAQMEPLLLSRFKRRRHATPMPAEKADIRRLATMRERVLGFPVSK